MTVAPAAASATRGALPALTIAAAAGTVTGAAVWFTRGLFDRVKGPDGPIRVALLPSFGELLILMVAGAAVALILAAGLRRRGGPFLPLFALAALSLPYLPIVADRLPLLTVLAGPAKQLLWAVVLGCTAGLFLDGIRGSNPTASLDRPDQDAPAGLAPDVHRGSLILIAGVLMCGAIGFRLATVGPHPGGDEPHYLVIAQSLWRDGDLQIANNHERGDYREYYGAPLDPHYLTKGRNGEIYSIHPIGMPVIVAPVYGLGGYLAVVLFLTTAGAVAAWLMWRWTASIYGGRAATFAWAALCLSMSYCLNALTVYPEILGALAVMLGLRPLFTTLRPATMLVAGLAIATLPWLSTKYSMMAGVLGLILLLHTQALRSATNAEKLKTALALVVPGVVSLAGWLGFFYAVWGTLSPSAPYGSSTPTEARYALAGVPGLLFDQEYGVMFYAPVLLIALAGLASMWRSGGRDRVLAVEVVAVFVALLIPVGAFHIWWGGSAVPGRPIASGLLLLGIPVAFQHARARTAGRALHWLLLTVSLVVTATIVIAERGLLTANLRDGSSRLLEWLSPDWPLWSLFPSFIAQPPLQALAMTLLWLGTMSLAWRWLRERAEQSADDRQFRGAIAGRAIASALFASLGIFVLMSLISPALRADVPDTDLEARARSPLLDGFDGSQRPVAVVYDPIRRVSPDPLPAMVRFVARRDDNRRPPPVPTMLNARFALPPGQYRAEVEADQGTSGSVALLLGRDGPPVSAWPLTNGASRIDFSLDVGVNFVAFRTASAIEPRIRSVAVQPVAVVDAHRRRPESEVLGVLPARTATFYFHDRNTWVEPDAFWTRGESPATMTIVRKASGPFAMRVGCGPHDNTFVLSGSGKNIEKRLAAGEQTEIVLPDTGDEQASVIQIATRAGFRPSDVETGSADRRFLGCRFQMMDDRR